MAQKSKLVNPFLFLCLLEKFKVHKLGGLFSASHQLQEYLLHFYFTHMLENKKSIDLDKRKTSLDTYNNYALKIKVNGIFQIPIQKHLSEFKYIRNIFLVEPRILLNIKNTYYSESGFLSFEEHLKKFDFKNYISDINILSNDSLRPILKNLIQNQKLLSRNFQELTKNDDDLKNYYKKIIKPLFLLVSRISEITCILENRALNSKFLNRIIDCYL